MSTNKRITDLTDYTSVLPYASEMFGVYQPMIGWRSKRVLQRMKDGIILDNNSKYKSILSKYNGVADIEFNQDNFFESASLDIGIQNKFLLSLNMRAFYFVIFPKESKIVVLCQAIRNGWLLLMRIH
jgi:hypothetical protein